jgi:transcriptional regulator with XRE-family HTH domain
VTALRLQAAMARANVGQSELARRLGVTPGAINQIATGRTRKSALLPEIAIELRTTLAYLRGDTDNPDKDHPDAHDLTSDEERMLDLWRQMAPDDRQALRHIIDGMLKSPTVHSPGGRYRQKGGR